MECHLLKQSACFISFQTREGLGARKFSFCIGIEFVLYYHSTERETQKEKKKKKKKKKEVEIIGNLLVCSRIRLQTLRVNWFPLEGRRSPTTFLRFQFPNP